MRKKERKKFLCIVLLCVICSTCCYAKSPAQPTEIAYSDDGKSCIKGNDPFEKSRVVSRRITGIEYEGIEYSKWIRITDVYRANTGRENQSVSAIPIYEDKQSITISASATIPVAEFLELAVAYNYDFSPSRTEVFVAVPNSGDMMDGEYTAYYIRKSWLIYKATVETVYEHGNTFNNPANQVTETTYEYYKDPQPIGPDDRTFIFSFDKSLLKNKLPRNTCDGYACTTGSGYDHPSVSD